MGLFPQQYTATSHGDHHVCRTKLNFGDTDASDTMSGISSAGLESAQES
jgi:hypothetical protein